MNNEEQSNRPLRETANKHLEDTEGILCSTVQPSNKNTEATGRKWLYLDDQRTPINSRFDVVRNYTEFCDYIQSNGIPELISFDHDLSSEHIRYYLSNDGVIDPQQYEKFEEKTGYDCAKWLLEYCDTNKASFNRIFVHSHNPHGTLNIMQLLLNYRKYCEKKEIHEYNIWRYEPEYKIVEDGREERESE